MAGCLSDTTINSGTSEPITFTTSSDAKDITDQDTPTPSPTVMRGGANGQDMPTPPPPPLGGGANVEGTQGGVATEREGGTAGGDEGLEYQSIKKM